MSSLCKRMLVMAVGMDHQGFMATATNYNETECTGEVGKCGCVHAEIALLRKMPSPRYVVLSLSPCINCAKALVEAEVETVEYYQEYRLTEGIEYLKEHHVHVWHIDNNFNRS